MKRVSFKIAKYIKEAGYPQGNYGHHYLFNGEPAYGAITGKDITAPTYFETWLWLWREKKMRLSVEYVRATETKYESWCTLNQEHLHNLPVSNGDPEEAISEAIEFLVDNDLIA